MSIQVEYELKTVVISQESDNDERYKRLQHELQHEREDAHKQIYERSTEIEHLRISMSSQEQEIKRLRREIEALEAKLKAQQPSSHSSSLILTTKKQPSDVQLIVPSQSKRVTFFKKTERANHMQDVSFNTFSQFKRS